MMLRKSATDQQKTGDLGEDIAARFLQKKHYKILERNLRSGPHELDLVVQDGNFIAFVEVKTRTANPAHVSPYGRPCQAVDARKRRSLIAAARAYIGNGIPGMRFRFDVIEVYLSPSGKAEKVVHIENAFTA